MLIFQNEVATVENCSQELLKSCNFTLVPQPNTMGISTLTQQLLFKVEKLATYYSKNPLALTKEVERSFEDFFSGLSGLLPHCTQRITTTIQRIAKRVKELAKKLHGIREGSKVDATALGKTFRGFGFVVRDHRNLTAAELRQTLKDLAKEKGPNGESIFQGYASLVVCLLSHGDQGTVCGVDNEEVNVVQLQYEIFNSESCPDLSDKPKIFIIQACQGDKKTLYDPKVGNDSSKQSSAGAIEPRPLGPPSGGSGTPTKGPIAWKRESHWTTKKNLITADPRAPKGLRIHCLQQQQVFVDSYIYSLLSKNN